MKKLLLTALAVISLSLQADPVEITITGASNPAHNGEWLVDTIFGTFEDNLTLLESQVWYGDSILANLFAITVGGALGFAPHFGPCCGDVGPSFLWINQGSASSESPLFSRLGAQVVCGPPDSHPNCPVGMLVTIGFPIEIPTVFAIATRPLASSVPEPATLGLLSLGLVGLGLARKRRQFVS